MCALVTGVQTCALPILLVLTMVLDPRVEIMVSAACVILLWSVIYAFATLLDVRLMLRLRKEQPAAHSHGAAIAAPELEMATVDRKSVVSGKSVSVSVDRGGRRIIQKKKQIKKRG